MKLFNNRPFIVLFIINIIYLVSLVDIHALIMDTKSNIRIVLGNIGIEQYQDKRKLESNDLVIYFNMGNSRKINKIVKKTSSYKTFLNNSVIHEPSIYKWGEELYNLNNEGFYYLVDFKKGISRNVIIYREDILSLLSSLSWLTVHGNADNSKTFDKKLEKILNGKLSVTCDAVTRFTSKILNQYNIENRIVSFLTMDTWNTYDNGHTLIEVKINDKYILFDLDSNQYFKEKEKNLNAKDFLNSIDFHALSFIKLSTDNNLDSQGFINKNINYAGFGDFMYNDLISWYKRVMQIPLILEDGNYYVGLANNQFKDRVFKYYPRAVILTKDEFNKKFYWEK